MLARHLARARPIRYAADPQAAGALRNYLRMAVRAYGIPELHRMLGPHLREVLGGDRAAMVGHMIGDLANNQDPSGTIALDVMADVGGSQLGLLPSTTSRPLSQSLHQHPLHRSDYSPQELLALFRSGLSNIYHTMTGSETTLTDLFSDSRLYSPETQTTHRNYYATQGDWENSPVRPVFELRRNVQRHQSTTLQQILNALSGPDSVQRGVQLHDTLNAIHAQPENQHTGTLAALDASRGGIATVMRSVLGGDI
jgi:hypothetical protein